MLEKTFSKKALLMGAFFVFVFFSFFSQVAFADTCSTHNLSHPESVTVKWVYDGDTLLLTDKRKIRLIGIDTPEVKHHKQKKQAYSAKAKEALRELLKKHNYRISLRYGPEKKDRYSRTLAHVFTPDGINISTWLLENSFAKTLVFPPNIQLAQCYKETELEAQSRSLRIWGLKQNQLLLAKSLSSRVKGDVRLKGKVKKVTHHKKSIIIELDSDKKSHIRLRIQKKHLAYFKKLNTKKLWDKTIIISGYLKNKRNKRMIDLKHPSQLRIVSNKNVKPTIKWSLKDAN